MKKAYGPNSQLFALDPATNDMWEVSDVGRASWENTAALRDSKIEDIHTNPHNGNQAAFNDSSDGVYQIDALMAYIGGAFNVGGSTLHVSELEA